MTRPTRLEPPDLWERDGSLRDAYVFNVTLEDWAELLALAAKHGCRYLHGGEDQPLPTPQAIFAARDRTHLLSVKLGGVTIHSHFFIPEEIELDMDPREVIRDADHYAILRFLEALSIGAKKSVSLTPENCPDNPYLSYDPAMQEWKIYLSPVQQQ